MFVEALRLVVSQPLPQICQRDVIAALEAGKPGPLEFLCEAGAEAGLPTRKILSRARACYLFFCTANLCDDLSDRECDYLPDPSRTGPCIQLALQNLFFNSLLEAELPSRTAAKLLGELAAMAGSQHVELRTKKWSAPRFKRVAEGIAGKQWSVYLQILWHGTRLARSAPAIGMSLGIAAHVAKDIESDDARFFSLSSADKRKIVSWATDAVQTLRARRLRCIDGVLTTIEPVVARTL